jgi:hypothetical protein
MDHFHDLKEWKVKDCGCQEMYVSNKQIDSIFLSEGSLAMDSIEEGDPGE